MKTSYLPVTAGETVGAVTLPWASPGACASVLLAVSSGVRAAPPTGLEPTPGALAGYGEPALVLILMVVAASMLVLLARRFLGLGRLEAEMSRRAMPPGAVPRGGVPGASYRGSMGGRSDGHSRIVPFPPSAEEEPEWNTGGLKLGGVATRSMAASPVPGGADGQAADVPSRLDEASSRPTRTVGLPPETIVEVAPRVRRISLVPATAMGCVTSPSRGVAPAAAERSEPVAAAPTQTPTPTQTPEAEGPVRMVGPRLKLSRGEVSGVVGTGTMAGPAL